MSRERSKRRSRRWPKPIAPQPSPAPTGLVPVEPPPVVVTFEIIDADLD